MMMTVARVMTVTRKLLAILTLPTALLLSTCTSAQKFSELQRATADASWPHPTIDDDNLHHWIDFVWPTENELDWQKVRWHIELADAQEEARKLQRPILLWTMNGHPCGET